MPSFSSLSSICAASEHFLLNVKFLHKLYYDSPSDVVHKVKGRLPKELDILVLSDLIFTISGSLDGQMVPSHEIVHSALVHKLRNDLMPHNALQLGINNISDAYIDEDDGLAKMTLTPSRSLSYTSRPHAILVAIELCYIWKTTCNRSTRLLSSANPFSDHLYLPFEPLLKRVTEQLFTNQLVGRYPLIFGTWCRRLDMEAVYFPSVAQSVLEIVRRSPNPHFVTRCKRLIMAARARHQSVLQASVAALSMCLSPSDADEETEGINASTLTPEVVLCETLEQLFRAGRPTYPLQARSFPHISSSSVEDDDQLVEPSQDDAVFNGDFPLIWPNLPDVRTDIDTQQTQPDDMDDDLDDWPKEALPGYTFSDMSAHSLINDLGAKSSSITPTVAEPSPTGSEDDSFALDLNSDHEQENVNVDMENAEFKRAVFHPFMLDHQPPQSQDGAFLTFVEPQEAAGGLEDFDTLEDSDFENDDWNCAEEMLFDPDESAGLSVGGPLCVSQVPKYAPDQDDFFLVTHSADQEYAFTAAFDKGDQVGQGSEDSFTDVWDL